MKAVKGVKKEVAEIFERKLTELNNELQMLKQMYMYNKDYESSAYVKEMQEKYLKQAETEA